MSFLSHANNSCQFIPPPKSIFTSCLVSPTWFLHCFYGLKMRLKCGDNAVDLRLICGDNAVLLRCNDVFSHISNS